MVSSRRQGPEYSEVQQSTFELLRDHFGYTYIPGEDLDDERGSEAEVLLVILGTIPS